MNVFAYIGAYIAVFIISALIYIYAGHDTAGYSFAAIVLINTVVHLLFIYKSWSAINDGESSVTPTKAVVFYFIPFFNILWASLNFMVFFGAFNSYIERHKITALKLKTGLPFFYFFYSLFIFYGIFYAPQIVGYFAIIQSVVFLVLVFKTGNAINSLTDTAKIGERQNETLGL